MPKNLEALGSLESFRAPWETEAGEATDIDPDRLKKYIFNVLTDKAKAQDARDEIDAQKKVLETELAQAKEDVAKASPEESNKKIDQLEKKLSDVQAKYDALESEKSRNELRSEVLNGLDPKYAKYVHGDTKEELEASLETVKADFGLEDGETELDDPRLSPRNPLKNPSINGDSIPTGDVDPDKAADQILGRRTI